MNLDDKIEYLGKHFLDAIRQGFIDNPKHDLFEFHTREIRSDEEAKLLVKFVKAENFQGTFHVESSRDGLFRVYGKQYIGSYDARDFRDYIR